GETRYGASPEQRDVENDPRQRSNHSAGSARYPRAPGAGSALRFDRDRGARGPHHSDRAAREAAVQHGWPAAQRLSLRASGNPTARIANQINWRRREQETWK